MFRARESHSPDVVKKLDTLELLTLDLIQKIKAGDKTEIKDVIPLLQALYSSYRGIKKEDKEKPWYSVFGELLAQLAAGAFGYLVLGRPIRLGVASLKKPASSLAGSPTKTFA